MAQRVLFFDIETASADLKWTLPPEEMFRLGGYSWGADGPVHLTEDLEELRDVIRSADVVVGHNIHDFDLTVVFGKDSIEPLEMALENRVWDTWTHATLVHPAPSSYVDHKGRRRFVRKPEEALPWYSLDNQAYQLGVAGKLMDLSELAEEFGGYDKIPLDDERYRAYLVEDVLASRRVAKRLIQLGGQTPYHEREQINAAIDAQNSRNGWRVDVPRAEARIAELARRREEILEFLQRTYDFPTEGAAPLRTKRGKEALTRALADVGISLDELPRTKKNGKKTDRPSFAGEGLIEVAKNKSPEAQELAQAVAELGGMRPLAQQALDCLQPDGRVHPEITTLQRSGRKSTTKPGLTTWSSRDPRKAIEKVYFIPNEDDHVLVEFDYSQADARIVAALSGDEVFAERFAPGADAHLITAWIVWGKDVVGTDKNDPVTKHYRNDLAKAMNHAYSYNAGPRTLAENAGVALEVAEKFVRENQRAYRKVEKWKRRVIKEGRRGSVTNHWGRRMIVDKDREFTQAPALYGQSGTREIVVDGLIRMARRDIRSITYLVAQVHDALVFSLPEAELDYWVPLIRECMETTWEPPDGTGMAVEFPVSAGPPAKNWMDAGH